ncbi:isoleucine--tRNA ligase [Planococcus sp. CAU13]|uniref:isoleucine--tRNA ligase n=1 Tax=Planococcus sp. CAU13 TaxID=1541197 RepID=UPI00052FFF03|nr:isoleucine--tRNA ligase [Planococcus sp. CAU13]
MDYKDTLLMPKTDFPMRGNLPNREPEMQTKWEEMDIYKKVQERTKGLPFFVLHDGPPYANGDLHMGHALNKVLKDMIVRSRSMMGFHAPYVPGWDTHGLPIEQALTNKGVNRKEMTLAEFRKLCEEYAYEQIDSQRTQFKRIGVRGDWENPYVTLKPSYEARQIEVFGAMASKGYIYKGLKPVYWSPSSESSLAEAEIEYHDKKSPSIYVSFPVTDGRGVLAEGTKFIIWTTTPWTIPANLGITVHEKLDYIEVEVNGSLYIIARELLDDVTSELKWEDPRVVREMKGAELENILTKHPLYDRTSLVMLGDHVTVDSGTGCVHTAPGHGEDDFLVSKKYGLDVLCPVDEKGVFTEEAPGFEGQFYDKANKSITEALDAVGALEALTFITHSYPHDWRTKKPVIYRATAQWFVSIEAFRDNILKAINETTFTPAWGETRLFNMLRDRGDWNISRQRVWGVPIPVFYAENGDPIITEETIAHIADLFRKHGSNVWFERPAAELLPPGFVHPSSPNGIFTKELDIMDVWFDSGSSHQAVLDEREDLQYPADLYLEGSDQYRGWFNSSLTTSVAINGIAPYKGILSHGFTLDGNGRKMSKSLGNVIVPAKVMNQMGADILRMWVASVDYTADVRVSDENFKQVSEVYRKIRNTLKYLHGNLADFNEKENRVAFEDMREMDQYMAMKLQKMIDTARKGYETYEFATIYNALNNYCANDLSSFYLDVAKDVVYIEAADHPHRRAMQTVMFDSLMAILKLAAPIIPHTADEMWSYLGFVEEDSVQLTDFPEVEELSSFKDLEEKWTQFMAVRDDVLKALEEARAAKTIGKSLEAKVTLYGSEEIKNLLASVDDNVAQMLIVSNYEFGGSPENALAEALVLNHVTVAVQKNEGEKCERCWTISDKIGESETHPTLCPRCADVVENHYA